MKRGFTLIELLIVVGILAILATTVTLVINPSNLLKEARDVQRISDLKTLSNAIGLYLTRSQSPNFNANGGVNSSYCNEPDDLDTVGQWFASAEQGVGTGFLGASKLPFTTPSNAVGSVVIQQSSVRNITGTGWVPIDFTTLVGIRPLTKLPVDPINQSPISSQTNSLVGDGYYYAYQCRGFTYEINANMESAKYIPIEANDGGTIGCSGVGAAGSRCDSAKAALIYEIGNDPGLDL